MLKLVLRGFQAIPRNYEFSEATNRSKSDCFTQYLFY